MRGNEILFQCVRSMAASTVLPRAAEEAGASAMIVLNLKHGKIFEGERRNSESSIIVLN